MNKKLSEIEERYKDYLSGGKWNWRGYIGIMRIEDLEYLIESVKKSNED